MRSEPAWLLIAVASFVVVPSLAWADSPTSDIPTPHNVSIVATRAVTPVLEARYERTLTDRLGVAASLLYGGSQESGNFAEISMFGASLQAISVALGTRRLGLSAVAEARLERHEGVSARNGGAGGPVEFTGVPGQVASETESLAARRTLLSLGLGLRLRASRRRLFVQATGLAARVQSWRVIELGGEQSERSASDWALPWHVSIGVWL